MSWMWLTKMDCRTSIEQKAFRNQSLYAVFMIVCMLSFSNHFMNLPDMAIIWFGPHVAKNNGIFTLTRQTFKIRYYFIKFLSTSMKTMNLKAKNQIFSKLRLIIAREVFVCLCKICKFKCKHASANTSALTSKILRTVYIIEGQKIQL